MSVNPYSFKPSTVFKALDKNKDGNITADEVSKLQKRLPARYEQAHALLEDLNYFIYNWHGGPSDSNAQPNVITQQTLKSMANNGSQNGLLNHVDFISNRPL
ncbi:MAG: EF-hand domain-containing protein [Vampirovibrionales bacterium]|nr:EF-hand domain-containing protein [Vampirovibrionales bacterium]